MLRSRLYWCIVAPIDASLIRPALLVHQTGGFSKAASRLGVPRSTVSRAVAALEDALGVTLFQRTTRRVTLTTDGQAFFERVQPAMEELETALVSFSERKEEPAGRLSVTANADIASVVLVEAIARFTARYPLVSVETIVSNRIVDLVADGVDLAIRVPRKPITGNSLVKRRVGSIGFSFYAAPSYLARRGIPRTDEELAAHDWVEFRGVRPMQFRALGLEIEPPPARASCDDMFFLRELVRRGIGIGVLASFLAKNDVTRGLLAPVPSRHRFGTVDVFLVRPAQKQVPLRVTAFIAVLLDLLKQQPLSPT
jgi:DNA-binding transcriptional LysR family regulator